MHYMLMSVQLDPVGKVLLAVYEASKMVHPLFVMRDWYAGFRLFCEKLVK